VDTIARHGIATGVAARAVLVGNASVDATTSTAIACSVESTTSSDRPCNAKPPATEATMKASDPNKRTRPYSTRSP
jgi:hypothetical protein